MRCARARYGAGALLLLGVASAARLPSEAIFPPQQLPIRFSHKQHLGFKLQCDFCHDRAESSTSARDNLIPSEESCRTCHKIDRGDPNKVAKPAARCDACHIEAAARVVVPEPNIKFNHKVHVDRQIPCQRCHGDLTQVDLATRAQLPRMPLCLGCHNLTERVVKKAAHAQRAPSKCTTCHLGRYDGTLETKFPTGILSPSGVIKGDAHTPQFVTEHARVAAQEEAYCQSCHRRDFCQSCHNGVVKPMSFHGNDYVSIHPIDARKQTTDCNGCHRRQTFCLGCHERSGVTDLTTVNQPGAITNAGRRFHPPYDKWVAPPRTPDHHSWQAQRNIRQCVSCHREDTCLECHSTFSGRTIHVNPHPPAFAGSRQCQALADRNGRVCLKCHTPTDPHLTCR